MNHVCLHTFYGIGILLCHIGKSLSTKLLLEAIPRCIIPHPEALDKEQYHGGQ